MVAAFVRSHGMESVKTAGTTDTYALTSTVPAGNLLVMALVHDNAAVASKPLVSSITKMSGETASWLHLGRALSTSTSTGAFADGELWAIKTTVAWTSGTSLTVTYDTTITMKSQNILEYSGVEATLRSTVGTAYSTTTTAASAATTGTTPVIGDLAIGLIFGSNVAATMAGDTDTLGGAWTGKTDVGSTGGSGATNNYGITQHKILTAASHQTLNNSAAMTAGNGSIVAILQATIAPLVTQAAYRVYGDGTETGSTALAAQDTAPTVVVSSDANAQVRVRLQETAGGVSAAATDWQLQWEKNLSGVWVNVAAPSALLDSYPSTNWDSNQSLSVDTTGMAESFLGDGKPLTRAGFYLSKTGTPNGTVTAALWAHTGTFGATDGVPTGSPLATSTTVLDPTTLTGTNAWTYFDFGGTVTLANGTPYCIGLISTNTGSLSNRVNVGIDGSTPAHAGTGSGFFTGAWSGIAGFDCIFEVYTGGNTVLPYDSASLTDAAATTNRLGAGSGSFVAGKISEDGLVDDLGWTASNYTEVLYSVTLKSADLANADSLRFRVLRDGVTTGMTYTAYPTITVSKVTTPQGTGTGSWSFAGAAVGKRSPKASPVGSWSFAGAAVGKRVAKASPVGSWSYAGTAVGTAPAAAPGAGIGTGTWLFTGAAVGKRVAKSAPTGTWTWTGAAVGKRSPVATTAGTWTFTGAATGKRVAKASPVGAWVFTGAAVGSAPAVGMKYGTATGTWTFAGAAVGKRSPKATTSGTLAWTGAAVGAAPAVGMKYGTATGTFTFTGAAVGKRVAKASPTGTWTFTGTAVGDAPPNRGTSTGTWNYTGTVVGKRVAKATTTGTWTWTGAAVGKRVAKATPTGAWSFAGAAVGYRLPKATSSGAWSYAGAAVGKRTPKAAPTGAWSFTGAGVGKRTPKATATGTWTYTGVATGTAPVVGQNDGFALGAIHWTGVASARTIHRATAAGTWTWVGTAAAQTTHRGTGTGAWSFSGAAVGKKPAKAITTGTWTWVGTSVGKRTPKATPTGNWTWAGVATGRRVPKATATGTWVYTGTAAGLTTHRATAAGSWLYIGTAYGDAPPNQGTAAGTLTWVGVGVGLAPALDFADGTAAGTWWFTGYAPGLARLFVTPPARTSTAGPDPRTSVAAHDPRVSVAAVESRVSVAPPERRVSVGATSERISVSIQ